MSYAVKGVSTERGLDAASFTLVAYGGAGPLHASAVAREIGMRELIVPRAPGHFSAFGMLYSDLRYDYVHTWFKRLAEAPFDEIHDMYARMVDEGRSAVARSAVTPRRIVVRYAMDMRYVGQEHAVTVEVSASLVGRADRAKIKRLFDGVHEQRYGTSAPREAAEIVGLRVTVIGTMRRPPLERIARGGPRPPAVSSRGKRKVHFAELGRFVETPAFQRSALKAGNKIAGPALIEEHASTTVLLPGDLMRVDDYGNLRITVGGRAAK
jgi:N-methylhydantoinase A